MSTKRSHILKQTYSFQDVSLRIQSESGKIRTRKTPNTVTFHAVNVTEGNQKKLRGGTEMDFTKFEKWSEDTNIGYLRQNVGTNNLLVTLEPAECCILVASE